MQSVISKLKGNTEEQEDDWIDSEGECETDVQASESMVQKEQVVDVQKELHA